MEPLTGLHFKALALRSNIRLVLKLLTVTSTPAYHSTALILGEKLFDREGPKTWHLVPITLAMYDIFFFFAEG